MKNNLSKILGQRFLKISDLHRQTKISRTTLADIYYQRTANVQLETLTKICDFLVIPLNELIEYDPRRKEGE